jgi:hypothetical protein
MDIAPTTLTFFIDPTMPWRVDWIWGCPLVIITVILHTWCLAGIGGKVIRSRKTRGYDYSTFQSALIVAGMTLLVTALHALEAFIWSLTYRAIGILPDAGHAMLYSLGAMTTFGNETVFPQDHWRLLGAIEALNGWLLFGLSTAFLFWLILQLMPRLPDQSK